MAGPPLSARVVLDDRTLLRLAGNATLVRQFPFLKAITLLNQGKRKPCGRCSRKPGADNRYAAVMMGVKRHIADMTPDNKKKLLVLLQTKQVQVSVPLPDGRTQKRLFS